jgi:hypothetical protein
MPTAADDTSSPGNASGSSTRPVPVQPSTSVSLTGPAPRVRGCVGRIDSRSPSASPMPQSTSEGKAKLAASPESDSDDDNPCLGIKSIPAGRWNAGAGAAAIDFGDRSGGVAGDERTEWRKAAARRFLTASGAFRAPSTTDTPSVRSGPAASTVAKRVHVLLQPDRESHTSDLAAFDAQVDLLVRNPRSDADAPFCAPLWAVLRQHLAQFTSGVGMRSLPSAQDCFDPGDDILAAYKARVIASAPLMPLDIPYFASAAGIPLQTAIGEFFRAAKAGFATLRFAPICQVCHGQSRRLASIDEVLGPTPPASHDPPSLRSSASEFECMLCHAPNHITYLDHVKAVFHLSDDIFYAPMQGAQCTISKLAIPRTLVLQPLPATERGSGFLVRCGAGGTHASLAPGRYRMRCPVADTDNTLVVRAAAEPDAPPCSAVLRVSELEAKPDEVIEVPHGCVNLRIHPDTKTFFALWIMNEAEDDDALTLVAVPPDEGRQDAFVSAADIARHPAYAELFERGTLRERRPSFHGPPSVPVREITVACLLHGHHDLQRGGKYSDWAALVVNQSVNKVLLNVMGQYGTVIAVEGGAIIACFSSPQDALRCVVAADRAICDAPDLLLEASNQAIGRNDAEVTHGFAKSPALDASCRSDTDGPINALAPSTRRFATLNKRHSTVSVASIIASDHAKHFYPHLRAAIVVGPARMRVCPTPPTNTGPEGAWVETAPFELLGDIMTDVQSAARQANANEILLALPPVPLRSPIVDRGSPVAPPDGSPVWHDALSAALKCVGSGVAVRATHETVALLDADASLAEEELNRSGRATPRRALSVARLSLVSRRERLGSSSTSPQSIVVV